MRSALKVIAKLLFAGLVVWGVVGCSGNGSPATNNGSGLTATTTALTSSVAMVTTGASLTLTATVTPAPAAGSVVFYDSGTALGTGTVSGSTATLATMFSTAGIHMLSATFSGTTTFRTSVSNGLSITATAPSTGAPSAPSGAATFTYVVQSPFSGTPTVLQFVAGVNGLASPISTLTLPLNFQVNCITNDSTGQIYVAGYPPLSAGVIEIFAAGASGTATPTRTITPLNGYAPTAMAVDAAGLLYAVDGDSQLAVYSSTASGAATPTRLIYGSATGIGIPQGMAVDTAGNIYISGSSLAASIMVFPPTANGNSTPARTITGAATNTFIGMAVDTAGNLYAALDSYTAAPYTSQILVYTGGTTGSSTPTRTISGTATELVTAGGLKVDGAGNIYVANQSGSGASQTYSLEEFGPAQTGNVAPVAVMTSTSWTSGGASIAIK